MQMFAKWHRINEDGHVFVRLKFKRKKKQTCNTSDCTKFFAQRNVSAMKMRLWNDAEIKERSSNSWLNYHECMDCKLIKQRMKNRKLYRLNFVFFFFTRSLHFSSVCIKIKEIYDSWPWHWISYHRFFFFFVYANER